MTEAAGKHSFSVEFNPEARAVFQQVEILNSDLATIEYRHGNSPVFYPIKMPGLGRVGNIAMHKGVFASDPGSGWGDQAGAQEGGPGTITISLADEGGARVRTWTLLDARPTKIVRTEAGVDGGKTVEYVEVVFERLVVSAS